MTFIAITILAAPPLWAETPSPATPPPLPGVFPFTFTPESDVPDYLNFRAEGLSLHEASRWAVSYMRKWHEKKYSAPQEEITYFEQQKQLLLFLNHAPVPAGPIDRARLAMVGDIMWIRTQWNRYMTPEVLDYFGRFDAVIGNLESPIDRTQSVPHYQPDCMTYNSDPGLVRSFRNANGTNVLTAVATANNHCLDCGDSGALETMKFLDEERILHSGLAAKKGTNRFVTFTRNGIKFGFHATTWGVNDPAKLRSTTVAVNWIPGIAPETQQQGDITEIAQILKEMKDAGCDFRIIGVHWGHEFEYYPTPATMVLGRRIVAAGADLIIGGHPHVQQPPEVCLLNGYEKRFAKDARAAKLPALKSTNGCLIQTTDGRPRKALILYSMGNFVSLMYATLDRVGLIDDLQVTKDKATGETDWSNLHGQFVFNKVPDMVKLFGENPRRLLLVDKPPYPCPELDHKHYGSKEDQTPLDFLRQHLGID